MSAFSYSPDKAETGKSGHSQHKQRSVRGDRGPNRPEARERRAEATKARYDRRMDKLHGEWDPLLPPPTEFGAPEAFSNWRPIQDEAVSWALDQTKRHIVMCLPTGVGKSLAGMVLGKYHAEKTALGGLKGRVAILTSRIGLSDQYATEFGEIGLRSISSWRNYSSKEVYKAALLEAYNAPIISVNYQYFFHTVASAGRDGSRLGNFDVLVCDESHSLFHELSLFMSADLSRRQFRQWGMEWPIWLSDEPKHWAAWCLEYAIPFLSEYRKTNQDGLSEPELDELDGIVLTLRRVAGLRGRWIVDKHKNAEGEVHSVTISKVWPGEDARWLLHNQAQKIIYMSATVQPKVLELTGLSRGRDFVFEEWPHPFPEEIRPVIHIPTIRATERTATEEDWQKWVDRIDEIIDLYPYSLGLVHTVSYKRAQMFLELSRHAESGILHTHSREKTLETVEWFRQSDPPGVLISPVMVTGFDLPELEYQIIGKVPWPSMGDPLLKARAQDDKGFTPFLVMQDLVQSAGRIVRGPDWDSRGVSFIIDDNIGWFMYRNKKYKPGFFRVKKSRNGVVPPW